MGGPGPNPGGGAGNRVEAGTVGKWGAMATAWGGLGATRWRWRKDVRQVVEHLAAQYPRARANTYVAHPWPGWGRVSVDWWGPGGRGNPIAYEVGEQLLAEAFNLTWGPSLRHTIWIHSLWTDFGGYSWWAPNDHSGDLRHVHLTYWK